MKTAKISLLIFPLIAGLINAQTWTTEEQYIQKFAPYAVEQMEKYKIPASITLAQGILETGGGQSRLAQEGKNHFGIKCKENWTGRTMRHNDDAPNECFRVYDDPKQSYEDHSLFLTQRPYYKDLFNLDIKDYKAWAKGLKKAGYATEYNYAPMLIAKIDKHKLNDFDNDSSATIYEDLLKKYPNLSTDKIFIATLEQSKIRTTPKTLTVPYKPVAFKEQQKIVEKIKEKEETLATMLVKKHPNGGLRFVIAPSDTSLEYLAHKFGENTGKLQRWNDMDNTVVKKNDIIFLEGKATEGNVPTYAVEVGDTMHSIAQKFGIKLSKLYSKNRMQEGEMPQLGQIIYLQEKKPRY